MRIVKVSATDSTNTYLREFCRNVPTREDILLWTPQQLAGRGQRGAVWESQPFKNLTFSIFKRVSSLPIEKQFYITMAASLAIYELLEDLGLERIGVKWPNDILSGNRKICGILIESVVKNSKLDAVIIGAGLNVNQTDFSHAPRATSLKLETGIDFEMDPLLNKIIVIFQKYAQMITKGLFEQIQTNYESKLFRNDKRSLFNDVDGNPFYGIIQGVSTSGRLLVLHEDQHIVDYGLKEIKLIY